MSELDGKKTIEQMFAEVEEAKKALLAARDQETKAANRVKDALNVFNGSATRLNVAMLMIHKDAPAGTVWNPEEGGAA